MALKLCCDGCDHTVEEGQATRVGYLEPAFYCAACKTQWDACVAELDELRIQAVKQFEAQREALLVDLRKSLKKLPDE